MNDHTKGAGLSRRALLAGGAALGGVAMANPAFAWVPTRAETSGGRVAGYFSAGVHVFKGIPYGAPAQETRFAAPRPVRPWEGVLQAIQWPAECPQYNPPMTGEMGEMFRVNNEWAAPQSEDCLALNIWTQGLGDGKKRPVMVWLHGGGYTVGSGSSEIYDGTNLATKGDVVVVTLNHRLNLFGYLYLGGMTTSEEFADSGNAGVLDLVEALRWVQANIAAFGGDPANVTIFGQSGGGGKVSTLLAMESARGLFHKAIVQSGPGVRAMTPDDADKVAHTILKRLDIAPVQLDRLKTLPAAELVRALVNGNGDAMGQLRLGPVVDGRSLLAHPFDPVAPAVSANVPVLIGSTTDESSSFFGAADPSLFTITEEELPARLQPFLGAVTAEAIAAYRRSYPDVSPGTLFFRIASDHVMRRGSIEIAERRYESASAPTYMYWLTRTSPAFGGKYGSPHSMDLPFVFNNVDLQKTLVGEDPARYRVAEACSAAWIAFARNGHPNCPELPEWRPYTPDDRATMLLDVESTLAVDPVPAVRTVLSKSAPWVF